MTEQQAGSKETQPPSSTGAGAEPPARPEPPARGRLADWQGPAFWMSCGALLAGLTGGAVVLAQRVGVERDLMAVATTLPPREEARATPSPAESAARRQVVPEPEPVLAGKPHSSAMEGTSGQDEGVRKVKTTRRRGASASNGSATHAQHQVSARQPERKKYVVRRKAAKAETYSEVFKRCPSPGAAGAVECRRHICNGAESEGQACRPYRGKLR
ncbi:hypothetical protein SAMN05518865_11612 [Duganella sp. CF458]|uniref:hypothetical protein n=1 Tax=Duganella sp. CF458 TaxID=1884368 RepID=UPI0008E7B20B|nr:hypothetical protein [Duganella sp. CF458]SFG67976.1 hypothetical protein SAMN05518865_11612 [Duganella sp. CF458]